MFNFKKKYGQNFLSDKNLLKAIVSDSEVSKDDTVLEIGAGAGALTQELSSIANKVIAFEIDADLEETLLSLNLKNVTFIFQDFMKVSLKDFEKDLDRYKVVANLPYYITTPIIFKLLEESEKVESLTIMVQKEVAERIVCEAGSKDYGILSVMIKFYGEAKINRIVKRQMFNPMPNVDSAVVTIKIDRAKYASINREKFSKLVKTAFSMRRKTLLNNLSALFSKEILKSKFDEKFLTRRAESLTIDEFINMYKILEK